MFKKSVHIDLFYQELPLEKRFTAAKRDGFDAIELYWGWEGRELKKLRELADENGLEISAISADLPKDAMISMCDPSQKQEYLESVKRSLEASQILGNKVIIAHAAAIDNKPPYNALSLTSEYSYIRKLCAMYEVLKTIAPWGEKAGIVFALEPLSEIAHSGYFLKDSQMCADIVEAVDSPAVKMLYDAYHAYLEEGKLCETISKYVKNFGLFHVADAPGRHEPGTGAVNWKNVLNHLKNEGYEGYVSFELYPKSTSKEAVKAIQKVLEGL